MSTEIIPTAEWIEQNYTTTVKLVNSCDLKRLEVLLTDFAEQYATCPASARKEHYSAFPGGLAYHNLHVLKWIKSFATMMAPDEISKTTMVKLAILHEIGKLGSKDQSYFVRQNGKYYDEKGLYYDFNNCSQFMSVPHRSLFLAQYYGIELTSDEFLAILLYDNDSDFYKYKEPKLALILHHAVQWARKLEKDNIIRWPE